AVDVAQQFLPRRTRARNGEFQLRPAGHQGRTLVEPHLIDQDVADGVQGRDVGLRFGIHVLSLAWAVLPTVRLACGSGPAALRRPKNRPASDVAVESSGICGQMRCTRMRCTQMCCTKEKPWSPASIVLPATPCSRATPTHGNGGSISKARRRARSIP